MQRSTLHGHTATHTFVVSSHLGGFFFFRSGVGALGAGQSASRASSIPELAAGKLREADERAHEAAWREKETGEAPAVCGTLQDGLFAFRHVQVFKIPMAKIKAKR
jgi:hypothetical protein